LSESNNLDLKKNWRYKKSYCSYFK